MCHKRIIPQLARGWTIIIVLMIVFLEVQPVCASVSKNALIRLLTDSHSTNQQIRSHAVLSLREEGTNVIPSLVEMLTEQGHNEKLAINGFKILGPSARIAVLPLAALLNDGTNSAEIALCLAYIGTSSVPVLLAALTNHDSTVRSRAATALGTIHPPQTNAVLPLIVALRDKTSVVRTCSAWALGQLKLEPDVVVPALTNCFRESDFSTRFAILRAVGDFGSKAKPAIPFLLDTLNDTNTIIRDAAQSAINRVRVDHVK